MLDSKKYDKMLQIEQ